MRFSRLKMWVILVVAIALGAALLQVSHYVQEAQIEERKLEAQLAKEKETMRVLQAEWEFLNSPSRLEALARDYLDIKAPDAARLTVSGRAIPEQKPMIMHEIVTSSNVLPKSVVRPALKPIRKTPTRDFGALLQEVTQ